MVLTTLSSTVRASAGSFESFLGSKRCARLNDQYCLKVPAYSVFPCDLAVPPTDTHLVSPVPLAVTWYRETYARAGEVPKFLFMGSMPRTGAFGSNQSKGEATAA